MANTIARWSAAWDERAPVENKSVRESYQVAGEVDHSVRSEWSTPAKLGSAFRTTWRVVWLETLTADISTRVPFGRSTVVEPAQVRPGWAGIMSYIDPDARIAWGPYGAQVDRSLAGEWSKPQEFDQNKRAPWGPYLPGPHSPNRIAWSMPGEFQTRKRIPWGAGRKADNFVPPPEPPPPPGGGDLTVVPSQYVYYQMNLATVSRLPELTPLNFLSLRISTDVDSFAPRWSGTLDRASYDLVKPDGATRHKIEVTIQGQKWHLMVEKPGQEIAFGRGDYQVSGRGQVAELAAPHTPARDFVSTADANINELADDELFNTGWTLNWSTEFWLVPAGAWKYEQLTPIQAVARLANAAGAVVQVDEWLKQITVKPRYPESPWNWDTATPNWSVPMAAVYRLSSDWSEKPVYNAVVVSGENQGVLCTVVRQGTAGDVQAPAVVDPLITHQDGARERARAVISDRGVQTIETLELPFRAAPDEPGLIRPLELLEYTDAAGGWRGLVLASDVSVEWGRGGLSIKQTVQVERHFND